MVDVTASVGIIKGRQCHNRVDDQQIVMDLLNEVPVSKGGTLQPGGIRKRWTSCLAGVASRELHEAILNFQRTNQSKGLFVDGHFDPGQQGMRVLNHLAAEPRPDPLRSTRFSISFLEDSSNPAGGAVATISCINETSVSYAYYSLKPRQFEQAIARKLRLHEPRRGAETSQFQTPEPMTPQDFAGPARLFELFNSGSAAVSRFFFTGNKSDGTRVDLGANFPSSTSDSDGDGTVFGKMEMREAGTSDRPLASRTLVLRPTPGRAVRTA